MRYNGYIETNNGGNMKLQTFTFEDLQTLQRLLDESIEDSQNWREDILEETYNQIGTILDDNENNTGKDAFILPAYIAGIVYKVIDDKDSEDYDALLEIAKAQKDA